MLNIRGNLTAMKQFSSRTLRWMGWVFLVIGALQFVSPIWRLVDGEPRLPDIFFVIAGIVLFANGTSCLVGAKHQDERAREEPTEPEQGPSAL